MQFPSRTLLWLKDGWEAEFVSDLGPSYVLHVRGSRKTPGKLVHRVERIVTSSHILWAVERDVNTPPDYKGRGLRPKRGPDGKVIRAMKEWLQPFHEGIKRMAPRGGEHPTVRYYWLISYLRWRGLPCLCGHADIVAHLSAEAGVPERHVQGAIERAAREAARTIGSRVPDNPLAMRGQTGHASRRPVTPAGMGKRPSRSMAGAGMPDSGLAS